MTSSTFFTRLGFTTAALLLSISALSPAAPVVAKPSEPEQNRPELGTPGQDPPTFAAGEILVGFKKDASEKEKSEIHQGHGASVKNKLPNLDIELVSAPRGKEKEQAAEYRKEPKVAFAEVNGRYYAQAKPVAPVAPRGRDPMTRWWPNNGDITTVRMPISTPSRPGPVRLDRGRRRRSQFLIPVQRSHIRI